MSPFVLFPYFWMILTYCAGLMSESRRRDWLEPLAMGRENSESIFALTFLNDHSGIFWAFLMNATFQTSAFGIAAGVVGVFYAVVSGVWVARNGSFASWIQVASFGAVFFWRTYDSYRFGTPYMSYLLYRSAACLVITLLIGGPLFMKYNMSDRSSPPRKRFEFYYILVCIPLIALADGILMWMYSNNHMIDFFGRH